MIEWLGKIFNFKDGWMVYRITVGFGTLMVGIAAIVGLYQLIRVANLLEQLMIKL